MNTAPSSPTACWQARIRGRVQGVGYRAACSERARELGLAGWVRNRVDGSVEAVFVGPAASLVAMQQWLHQGPPAARVDSVDVTPCADVPAGLDDFEQRPTA